MNLTKVDKEVLKDALKEIMNEDSISFRDLLKEVVREVLSENDIVEEESDEVEIEKLQAYLNEVFVKYDEVFKALA